MNDDAPVPATGVERAGSSPLARTGAGPLAAGTIVSGVAAYAVIALGTRAIGEVSFAPVSVLWSLWALSAAAISFPVQHWTIRTAETETESAVWALIPRLALLVGLATVGTGVASLLLGTGLYPASSGVFSLMTALLPAGSLLVGLQRGLLAHRRRFGGVAVTFAGENLLRALVATAVLVLDVDGPGGAITLGWGIIAGFAISAAYLDVLRPPDGPPSRGRPSLRLLGGFVGANVSAQVVLTSGPVALALLHAPERVITEVFALLALLRVPYTGLVGASAAITGPLTRHVHDRGVGAVRRLEMAIIAAGLAAAATAAALASRVLPPLVSLLFGTTLTVSAASQAMLAAGGVLALTSLLEMLLLLAARRARRLVLAWMVAILVAGAVLLLPLDTVTRVSVAFLVAEATSLAVLAIRRE